MSGRKMVGVRKPKAEGSGQKKRPAKANIVKAAKPPIGVVAKVTAEKVLNDNLATALKSGRYLVVVAHVEDGRLWHSQTSKSFPLADLAKVFEFVNRELTVGARAK